MAASEPTSAQPAAWRQLAYLGLIVALGLALAVTLRLRLSELHERALRAELAIAAQARVELIRSSWLRSLEALHATVAYLEATDDAELSRSSFRRFVSASIERMPEVQALEWIPHVRADERARHEARAASDVAADYRIRELAPRASSPEPRAHSTASDATGSLDQRLPRASARGEYFPVMYAEPPHRNLAALGLDLGAHPLRRRALERARETGQPAATAPVRLAQETRAGALGLLVFARVNDAAEPSRLRGFGLVVLRIEDFVRPALASLTEQGLSLRIVDAALPQLPLVEVAMPATTDLRHESRMSLAGRDWRLTVAPTPEFLRLHRSFEPLAYPLAVLALTWVIAGFTARAMRRTRQLELARCEAAEARSAQARFLADMSHEIRTPLNAIIGYSQVLARSDSRATQSPLQREAVQAITQGGHHLLSLVDDVIDLSKIEAGHIELTRSDFDLCASIAGLAALFKNKCERKGLALRVEGLGDEPYWVRGDEGKLRQILINLLGNAVKFTERGEVLLRVVPQTGRGFRFEVIDTGPGIASADQARVFGEFYRAERQRAAEGAGLGLGIARRLVARMGGVLGLHSELGRGSTFHFALEFESPRVIAPSEAKAQHPRVRLAPGARCRVLVVDDLEVNRNLLTHTLEAIGCEVQRAESGRAALHALERFDADVVMLDVVMPDMDGFATARAIRADRGAAAPKLVAFSASALDAQRASYLTRGFDACLPKPFRVERIIDSLAELLGLSFVADAEPAVGAAPEAGAEPAELSMAAPLLARIREAAESYQVTRLRRSFEELERGGHAERALAAQLRASAARFDMAEVVSLVSRAERAGRGGHAA